MESHKAYLASVNGWQVRAKRQTAYSLLFSGQCRVRAVCKAPDVPVTLFRVALAL